MLYAYQTTANVAALQAYGLQSALIAHAHIPGVGPYTWNAASSATADGLTIISATGVATGRWLADWPLTAIPLTAALTAGLTLSQADAIATALNILLHVDANVTLAANATLNSNLFAAGGVITMNGFNLTINGTISGPDVQIINVGAIPLSGTLTINGGTIIRGTWLTGAYGQNIDYSPGVQAGVNIVMRASSSFPGPRVLDLSSGNVSSAPSGINLQHSISFPTGSGVGGGTILADGQVFQVSISGANSPVFTVGSAILWAFKAGAAAKFQWNPSNLPTSSNTQAVVFQFTQGSTNFGSSQFVIDGVFVFQGYGFATTDTVSTNYNGWWSCMIQNITCQGCVGTMINCTPPAGGNERQHYKNLLFVNNATGGNIPVIKLQNTEYTIEGLSIDAYGNGAQGAATAFAVHTLGCTGVITDVHLENSVWGGGSTVQVLLIDGNTSPGILNSQTTINCISVVGDISIAANTTLYIAFAYQGACVTVDNMTVNQLSLGAGAVQAAIGCDANSFITVGRSFVCKGNVVGWVPYATSTTFTNPSGIIQVGEKEVPYYFNTLPATQAETDMTSIGSTTTGVVADRTYYYQGLTFNLTGALGAGSITLRTYSGTGSVIDTQTIVPASGANGVLQFKSGIYQTASKYTAGQTMRVTVQSAAIGGTTNIQVGLRVV